MAPSSLKRDVPLGHWLQSLKDKRLKPSVLLLEEVSEENWREAECKWIAYYLEQGANLTNISPGGYQVSKATRLKLTARPKRQQKVSEATKERYRALMKKFYEDPEERRKSSERARKNWANPEWHARQATLLHKSGQFSHRRGERNSSAKLSVVQVQEIRRLHAQGNVTQQKLADSYGVSKTTIRKILQGKTWQGVA